MAVEWACVSWVDDSIHFAKSCPAPFMAKAQNMARVAAPAF
jgi:hypothetical protein